MGFLRNRVARRIPVIGVLSDLALVGAAANRLVQKRRGGTGVASASGTGGPAGPELLLAGAAAFRLLRRVRRSRKRRRALRAST
jgi:hypothetical protein